MFSYFIFRHVDMTPRKCDNTVMFKSNTQSVFGDLLGKGGDVKDQNIRSDISLTTG